MEYAATSELWRQPEAVRELVAKVVAVLPEFHQARLRDDSGFEYSITDMTAGVSPGDLHEGQVLRCVVTVELPRVISASVIG